MVRVHSLRSSPYQPQGQGYLQFGIHDRSIHLESVDPYQLMSLLKIACGHSEDAYIVNSTHCVSHPLPAGVNRRKLVALADILPSNKIGLSMNCNVADMTVHYEEIGSGHPLVVLHGWPLDHRHMRYDLEPLFENRSGWRRIYPDLPGMGKTAGADWITHQDQVLDIVLTFIDSVTFGERFVVVGTSYSGYLARGGVYHRRSQMDGMFINVPVVQTDKSQLELPPARVLVEDAEFLAALRPDEQNMRDFIVAQSPELLQVFRQYFSSAGAVADHTFLDRLRQNYAFGFDVDSLSEPFEAPALILTGRYDNWWGYRDAYRLLDNYPRATYAVLDRAGHVLALEQKNLFRSLASEWLDRVEEYIASNPLGSIGTDP